MVSNTQFEFIYAEKLREKIIYVMNGKSPKLSVAFLGNGWLKTLFNGTAPEDLKIICDLKMHITPKSALIESGAPNNKNLRFLENTELHGKIYLSDLGAIVTSANATYSGLIKNNRLEDGVWIPADSPAYQSINQEFEKRFLRSSQIGKKELDTAPLDLPTYEKKTTPSNKPRTLFDAIRHDHTQFRGIGFIFSSNTIRSEVIEEVNQILEEESSNENIPIKKRDYFSNWDIKEDKWPSTFFSIHKCDTNVYLKKNRHFTFISTSDDEVYVSEKIDWRRHGPSFGGCPRLATLADCKHELKDFFSKPNEFKKFKGKVMTADEIFTLIQKL